MCCTATCIQLFKTTAAMPRLSDCVHLLRLCQCRLELNYAHQLDIDKVPLMMEKNYQPTGWCECKLLSFAVILTASNAIIMQLTCNNASRSGAYHGHQAVVRDGLCVSAQPHVC